MVIEHRLSGNAGRFRRGREMEPEKCPHCGGQMVRPSTVEIEYRPAIEITMGFDTDSPSLQPREYSRTDSRWILDQDAEDFKLLEAALAEDGPRTSLDDMIEKYGGDPC